MYKIYIYIYMDPWDPTQGLWGHCVGHMGPYVGPVDIFALANPLGTSFYYAYNTMMFRSGLRVRISVMWGTSYGDHSALRGSYSSRIRSYGALGGAYAAITGSSLTLHRSYGALRGS